MTRVPFLALLLVGCNLSPVSPDGQAVAHFVFQGATQSEQEAVEATWQAEAGCLGMDPDKARLVPFTVLEGRELWCGKILAAGCTGDQPPRITVRREWFSLEQCIPGYGPEDCHAMSNELMHLALLLHGESWNYSNPNFGRCRR